MPRETKKRRHFYFLSLSFADIYKPTLIRADIEGNFGIVETKIKEKEMGRKSNLSSRHFSSAFPNYSSFFVDNTTSKKINTAQVASLFMFLSECHSKSWRNSWQNIQYKRDVKQLTLYVYWRNKRETTYFNARYHAVQWCRSVALIFFFSAGFRP